MGVGIVVDRAKLDGAMAQLALITFANVRAVADLNSWAAGITEADLQDSTKFSPPYTANEAFAILSVLQRLKAASDWLGGGAEPTEVHDTLGDLAGFQGLGTAPG
jgi:hypothetical protein